MSDSTTTKKGRFRVLKGGGQRVVNPRTGTDDGKGAAETVNQYTPTVADPILLARLTYTDPWFSAGIDAIADNVGAADVFPAFESTDPAEKEDEKIFALLKAFLEADDREYTTPGERLAALAMDYKVQGYCAFEVGRDSKRMPAAWYHVPAATLKRREPDHLWEQKDYLGKVVAKFGEYKPGGREDGLPELMVIRKYDPCAQYLGSPSAAVLLTTVDRLKAQDDYNTKLLRKGGIPPWLLFLREQLDDDDLKRLEEWFRELEAGDSSDLVGILDGVGEGADMKKLTDEQADVSHIEGEKLLRERTLGVLKVPPTKVSLAASNYATAVQEDATFKFQVVQPILRIFLKRLSVVGQELVKSKDYHFTSRQQSLEDYLAVCQAEEILLRNGVHTINQMLARLGLPGIGPVGDVRIAFTAQGPIKLEDLAAGNLPATPGRLVDALLQARKAIEETHQESRHVPGVPPKA